MSTAGRWSAAAGVPRPPRQRVTPEITEKRLLLQYNHTNRSNHTLRTILPSRVVCGRGGSAMTWYVDMVVGLEVDDDHGKPVANQQQEFFAIDRDALPSLQSFIEDAIVAPRQREAKRKAKDAAPAE
ncbi:hypothetical protein Esi_0106_0071 [Ectocarpus siliculosus]|uniref:Uncharacterized protein n=1 Tax=Ectocarpus siliculosus TaxID=2880 RepID=D7FHA1_ECTSI|nr:hypothetical protein Esi_0106_0071 [Ectocarpus siliculosus]|eukprot:CBJ28472.1 hypothetical protein Esi_0106_0071 [Ectocarpus siliculosus]